jgi:hypothetical protein
MKKYSFLLKGIRHLKDGNKIPYSHSGEIEAFNFSHALSHVLNLCKECHVQMKQLNISENV